MLPPSVLICWALLPLLFGIGIQMLFARLLSSRSKGVSPVSAVSVAFLQFSEPILLSATDLPST